MGWVDLFRSSPVETALMWKWAFEHPFLWTGIKLGTPSLFAVILGFGWRVVRRGRK